MVKDCRACDTMCAQDSGAKIDRIGQLLSNSPPDYHELDQLVHQFKGSSASLGAAQIAQLCIRLRESCQQQDQATCVALQHGIRAAYADLKTRLEAFMQLEGRRKQLLAAGVV
jgi:histidine-containing phosphotransfer protein